MTKNPFMSAWLSMANQAANTGRGHMMAEMQRQQTMMMKQYQQMWVEAWMSMMFPMMAQGKKKR